ncbi:MAG: FeoB-associated Cys-rich membrane protein [Treponema sp.]|nr:FeoB-associated Cys-rich membrane protein [Treponema sp.]
MGTILVLAILMAVVAAIILNLVKNKKQGKSSCGCSCSCCPMAGSCHSSKNGKASPSIHTTILEIDGMMCQMCESHVNDAIRNNFKVKDVKSSHKTGLTQIQSDEVLDEELLRKTVEETGYKVKSVFKC